jgi:peptide/nickel transport system permease protein
VLKYVVRRIVEGVLSLALVGILVFAMVSLLGDPVAQLLPPNYSQEEYDTLRHALGYDQPTLVRFADFSLQLLRGDLGSSISYQEPVSAVIFNRLPVTLTLTLLAMLIGYTLAVVSGFVAGFMKKTWLGSAVTFVATLGMATPSFAIGIFLIVIFAISLRILPAGGWGTMSELILPVVTLSIWVYAGIARVARSSMQERATSAYITLARTRGMSEPAIFLGHAFRVSLPPTVTYGAVLAGSLLSGAVVTESLFGIPGLGSLAVDAVRDRDQPLVIGVVLFAALAFIVLNLLSDLAVALLDPRIRLEGGETS